MLYQKIVAAFPEGWMSSGQISRDDGWWWLLKSFFFANVILAF